MVEIEPYKTRARTNLQEHNDIVNKLNEVVEIINDTDMDNLNTRLTNDESQIAVNTAGIKANTTAIDGLIDSVDTIDKTLDTIEPMVTNHEIDIANLKTEERRLSADMPATYTLYRNGEGKIKAQVETVGGTLIDSNTLDMIIPYQYDIVSGTTDRSFKLKITMSDGSNYTTNDFIIPEGGGSEIVVTGITLSKDSTNVNRFHVGINLSDSTMIDSGYISMVDNVVATYADSKLTISVNGVSSVPVAIETGSNYTAGNGITITSGTIAIDDTVVALKSDIADMLTKTDADAEYATKTALALTDSVANDANEKANSAIDNVSISGSTMTFTKINDEHIDVTIPSLTIVDCIKYYDVGTIPYELSSGQVIFAIFRSESNADTRITMVDNVCCLMASPFFSDHTSSGITCYKITPSVSQFSQFANSIKTDLSLTDGKYEINMGYGGLNQWGYFEFGGTQGYQMRITISDDEIISISKSTDSIWAYINNPASFKGVGLVIYGIRKINAS